MTAAAGAMAEQRRPGEAEVARLIERSRRGDAEAREELVRRNLRLVRSVANRFRRVPVDDEDLFQAGCMGLVKAVDRFDPGRGVAFSTFAVPCIAGEILSYLRGERLVKVGRATQERARQSLRLREALAQELGREPTVREVAERLGADEEDVVEALDAVCRPVSLDAPLWESGEDDLCRGDTVPGPQEDPLERIALAEGLRKLPDLERRLVELRFFGQRTQVVVGQELGLSQVQVCRLEKRALERLRRAMS